MKITDGQIKDIVTLKDYLLEQIDQHQKTIDLLEKNLNILDSFLKQSSFIKASELNITNSIKHSERIENQSKVNPIPITRGSGGEVIANAFITPEQVSIVLNEKIGINVDTPPFKSFFINRIIGEMKRKDSMEADTGKIRRESIIDYVINKNGSNIREIIIKNYKQKDRINEIINTAGWSLTRMLENTNK